MVSAHVAPALPQRPLRSSVLCLLAANAAARSASDSTYGTAGLTLFSCHLVFASKTVFLHTLYQYTGRFGFIR